MMFYKDQLYVLYEVQTGTEPGQEHYDSFISVYNYSFWNTENKKENKYKVLSLYISNDLRLDIQMLAIQMSTWISGTRR